MPTLPGVIRRLRIGNHRDKSRTVGNWIDDCRIDVAAAQHRHQVRSGGAHLDGWRIHHARHVPFFERDPLDGVELDPELIGDQGTDPDGGCRCVGTNADAAAGQAGG